MTPYEQQTKAIRTAYDALIAARDQSSDGDDKEDFEMFSSAAEELAQAFNLDRPHEAKVRIEMEGLSSQQEIEWAKGPFNDGAEARIFGYGLDQCPSEDVIGTFAVASWLAGWADANKQILADGGPEKARQDQEKITSIAKARFGEVLDIRATPKGGYVLLIQRTEPANEALPFMTIRGVVNPNNSNGGVDFNWGHYDMNEVAAKEDFATR